MRASWRWMRTRRPGLRRRAGPWWRRTGCPGRPSCWTRRPRWGWGRGRRRADAPRSASLGARGIRGPGRLQLGRQWARGRLHDRFRWRVERHPATPERPHRGIWPARDGHHDQWPGIRHLLSRRPDGTCEVLDHAADRRVRRPQPGPDVLAWERPRGDGDRPPGGAAALSATPVQRCPAIGPFTGLGATEPGADLQTEQLTALPGRQERPSLPG